MKRKFKYDPEDLESLLLNKRFDELYPEEKEFVLRHMDSAEEYASMRKTLLSIVEQPDSGPAIRPRSSTKRKLMREFEDEKTATWQVWLNGIFLPFNRRPVLSYATLAVILIVGGLFFFNQSDTDKVMLAENKEQPKEEQQEADKTDDLEKNLEPADNSSEEPENELPSAETEEELEEELPSVDESETIQSTQKEEIEINEDVKEDAVMDLQVAEATNKTTKDMETPADSEISNERKVTAAESEPSQSTEELAESIQPQIVREEVADEKLTVTETNTDSFMMDDQMGNMYEQTTMQSQDIVVGKEARLEVEPTSMSKASFLLQNLHTSM